MSKFLNIGATVALIILVDIATGQGPPGLQNYISGPQEIYNSPPIVVPPPIQAGYLPPPPPPPPHMMQGPRPYPQKEEKEYEKQALKDKEQIEKFEKEFEKGYKSEYGYEKTTPAPGVFASFQNSMSNAWKGFTALGRSKRSLPEAGASRMIRLS